MQIVILLVYVVAIGAMMYFLAIKPQKKQQKQQQELMDSIEKGDYVLTTSGFYGVIIDVFGQLSFFDVFNLISLADFKNITRFKFSSVKTADFYFEICCGTAHK